MATSRSSTNLRQLRDAGKRGKGCRPGRALSSGSAGAGLDHSLGPPLEPKPAWATTRVDFSEMEEEGPATVWPPTDLAATLPSIASTQILAVRIDRSGAALGRPKKLRAAAQTGPSTAPVPGGRKAVSRGVTIGGWRTGVSAVKRSGETYMERGVALSQPGTLFWQDSKETIPVRELHLAWWGIGAKQALRLTETHTSIVCLDLTGSTNINDTVVEALSGCPKVNTLILNRCHRITDDSLLKFRNTHKSVKVVDLSGCYQITDDILRALATGSRRLHTLLIPDCVNVTDMGMVSLGKRPADFEPLTTLDISRCSKVTDAGVLGLLSATTSLTSLTMAECKKLHDIAVVGAKCPNLRHLDWSGLYIGDPGLAWIATGSPRLETLILEKCFNVTDKGMIAVADNCFYLRHLNIRGCNTLTSATLTAFTSTELKWRRLETVILDFVPQISDHGLASMANHCTGITDLSITGLNRVTDEGLMELTEHCRRVQHLRLSPNTKSMSAPAAGAKVGNKSAFALAAVGRKLRSLHAGGMRRITNDGCLALAAGCPSLTSLNLATCIRVTDAAVAEIAVRCTALTELVLSSCKAITDVSLAALGAGCKGLQVLSAARCEQLTDDGLRALAVGCTKLQTLNVAGVEKLTDVSLRTVARKCRLLSVLNISQVRAVTNRTIQDLADRCPALHTVTMTECDEVTASAVHALAVALPLAKLSDSMFGVQPTYGPNSLAVRSEYLRRTLLLHHHAGQVQRLFRGFGAQKMLERLKQQKVDEYNTRRHHAAVAIQRRAQTWLARRWFKWVAHRRWNAALYVQSWYRSQVARIYVTGVRREFKRHNRAARKIQTRWRGHATRARYASLKWAHRRSVLSAQYARVVLLLRVGLRLQAWWRMCLARRMASRMVADYTRAAIFVQRTYRGAKVRLRVAELAAEMNRLAAAVQASYRGLMARRRVWAVRVEWCRVYQAATMLQRIYRGAGTRREVRAMALQRRQAEAEAEASAAREREEALAASKAEAARRQVAALVIQRAYRLFQANRLVITMKAALAFEKKLKQSVRVIQRAGRRYLVRKRLWERRQVLHHLAMQGVKIDKALGWRNNLMYNGAVSMIQYWWHGRMARKEGAIVIQSTWRMYLSRKGTQTHKAVLMEAASVIQLSYRRALRLRYWKLLVAMAVEVEEKRLMEIRNKAAAILQARYRIFKRRLYTRAIKTSETYLLRRMGALRREQQLQKEAEERASRAGESYIDKLERERRKKKLGKTEEDEAKDRVRQTKVEVEKRGMAFAIHRKQRRLVNIVGITAIVITVGEAETQRFAETQEQNKKLKKRVFVQLPVDLSEPLPRDVSDASMESMKERKTEEFVADGLGRVGAYHEIQKWIQGRAPSRKAQHVFLWLERIPSDSIFSSLDIHQFKKELTAERQYREFKRMTAQGLTIIRHVSGGTKLELRASKKPTEEVIIDLTAAPWIPGSEDTDRLLGKGFEPLYTDLGDLKLAEGLQLWIKRDSKPRDASAMLMQDKLSAAKYYSPRLQHVIDMLQLTKEQVDVLLDAFVALDYDTDGVVLFNEFVESINVLYTPFSRFIIEFLDIEPTVDDGLNFGEWAHCVATLALFEREEMIRFAFAFADTRQELAIDDDAMRKLIQAIYSSTTGISRGRAMMEVASRLPRDAFGLIPLEQFNALCIRSPALLFPLVRMRDAIMGVAMGKAFWERKKTKYAKERRIARRARDLGMLVGGNETNPAVLQAMFIEMAIQKSKFVLQAFIEEREAGVVAVVSVNETAVREHISLMNRITPAAEFVEGPKFNKALLADIRTACEVSQVDADQVPKKVFPIMKRFAEIDEALMVPSPDDPSTYTMDRKAMSLKFVLDLEKMHAQVVDEMSFKERMRRKVKRKGGAVGASAGAGEVLE